MMNVPEATVITFENLQRLFPEPDVLTHQWAAQCVMCLQNFTTKLTRSKQQVDSLRYSLRQLLIGSCVFAVARFDFRYFSVGTQQPVAVFGQYFETYHAAARDLFNQVFDAVFRVIVPRGNEITEADVKRFNGHNMSQVADAVWKTTRLAANEAEDKLNWLLAAVINEAQRAREIHGRKTLTTTISSADRTIPLSYRRAAKLMGKGDCQDAAEWLSASVKDGSIPCDHITRQAHVFSKQFFPEKVWPDILPQGGKST